MWETKATKVKEVYIIKIIDMIMMVLISLPTKIFLLSKIAKDIVKPLLKIYNWIGMDEDRKYDRNNWELNRAPVREFVLAAFLPLQDFHAPSVSTECWGQENKYRSVFYSSAF